jgi:hypothetical protein
MFEELRNLKKNMKEKDIQELLETIFNLNLSVKIGRATDDLEIIKNNFDTVFKDLESTIQKEEKEI